MRLWIDTEFNSFNGPLISMALVDEYGHEWYEVLKCDNPHPWVARHVIPVLNKQSVTIKEMQHSLFVFLKGYQKIHIIADWPEDIAHFCQMLITGPGERIGTPPLTMEVKRDLQGESLVPHNALADARSLRIADLGIYINKTTP